MRAANPSSINEIEPEKYYAKGHLSGIVFPDGRRLDEALRNHPLAPDFTTLNKAGKYQLGSEIIQFWNDCMSGVFHKVDSDLLNAMAELSSAKSQLSVIEKDLAQREKTLAQKISDIGDVEKKARLDILSVMSKTLLDMPLEKSGLKAAMGAGVYFLFNGDYLVYIGQSRSVLSRIGQHADKDFDRFRFIPCQEHQLNDVEGFFIKLLSPKLNGSCGPRTNIRTFNCLASTIMTVA